MSSAVSSSRGSFSTAGTGSLDSIRSFGQFEASEMDPSEENEPELLSLSWNQDYQCFAAGTSHGLRIYDCDPFKETFRRNLKSGFSIVEMLFRSNVMALVGGGSNPQYPPNKVMIWDDHQNRCLVEYAYRSNIRAVKLRQDRIVVVLEHKINVYDFTDLKLIHQIETISNPRGLCCLSHYANTSVLACPGLHRGQVQVKHFGLKVTKFISAHDSQLACLTLTLDGFLLATASVKGTLIRIFNTMDGTLLQEVRRGADKADIYNLALSPTVRWLAVSSDKGTVHIFSLRVRIVGEDPSNQNVIGHDPQLVQQNSSSSIDTLISPKMGANTSSSLSFMKGVLPKYFSSEWSFAQFHLPEATRYTVAFGAHNTVIILGLDGSFYKCSFDPVNGGEMVQQEYIRFIKNDNHRPIPPTS